MRYNIKKFTKKGFKGFLLKNRNKRFNMSHHDTCAGSLFLRELFKDEFLDVGVEIVMLRDYGVSSGSTPKWFQANYPYGYDNYPNFYNPNHKNYHNCTYTGKQLIKIFKLD